MAYEEDATPPAPACACDPCQLRQGLFEAASRSALRIATIRAPGNHGDLFTVIIYDAFDRPLAYGSAATDHDALYLALRGIGVVP